MSSKVARSQEVARASCGERCGEDVVLRTGRNGILMLCQRSGEIFTDGYAALVAFGCFHASPRTMMIRSANRTSCHQSPPVPPCEGQPRPRPAGARCLGAASDALKHFMQGIRYRRLKAVSLPLILLVDGLTLGFLFQNGFVLQGNTAANTLTRISSIVVRG